MNEIVVFILTLILLGVAYALFKANKELKSLKNNSEKTSTISQIEQLKSIGELSVFQVYSKEIVTKTDHAFGNFGKEYLRWLVSEKKLSMIFEFEINFIYDLNSQALQITQISNSKYHVKMPPCKYKFSIADMKFYDEKDGKFIPFLLPDSLNGLLGSGFREEDKNRLINDAKAEVQKMSVRLIKELQGKIHKSARDTLEAIAKSFGAMQVSFEFDDDNTNIQIQNVA